MRSIIIITGQTATGKTKLALEYAQKYNGELINCDSRQIYKRLDIITGKDLTDKKFYRISRIGNFDIGYYQISDITPEVEEADVTSAGKNSVVKTKIWLYDIINPNQYFSSFDYQQCALWVVKKILSEGKTPIIVGGTAFYLYHLLYKVETETIPPNWNLRTELASKSVYELERLLLGLNVQSFNRLNNSEKNNPQRLIRKIEIARFRLSNQYFQPLELKIPSRQSKTGKKIILSNKVGLNNIKIKVLSLQFKNTVYLRKAVQKRLEERLNAGAISEVKQLIKLGFSESDPGLKTIGYQQLLAHIKDALTKEQAIDQWTSKETQYAKRQIVYIKKYLPITTWFTIR